MSDDGASPPAGRKREAPDAPALPPPPISTPSFRVDGLHFVVTGASKGLGLAVANMLAAAGAGSPAFELRRAGCAGDLSMATLPEMSRLSPTG